VRVACVEVGALHRHRKPDDVAGTDVGDVHVAAERPGNERRDRLDLRTGDAAGPLHEGERRDGNTTRPFTVNYNPEVNAADPVLSSVPEDRRGTLVAQPSDDGYRFDVRIQGDRETVFFDV
jgi:hypothetical protein